MKLQLLGPLLFLGLATALSACGPSAQTDETVVAPTQPLEQPANDPAASEDFLLPGSTTATDVDPATLDQFVSALNRLQQIQVEAEAQSIEALEAQGLSEQRFNEILQSQQNPAEAGTTAITPEEQQQIQQAAPQLAEIQQEAQTQMDAAIQAEGFNEQSFNEVLAAVRQDPALQQQVRDRITTPN